MMSTIRRRSSRLANSTVILPLALPRSTLTRVSRRSESRSASSSRPGRDGLLAQDARSRLLLAAERDDLLQSAHGDALRGDPGGEPVLETGVVDGEQGAGVAGREDAGGDATLDGRGELQQPQRVGDLRPRAADALGELLVGAAEVLEQLAVGGRLLERVELRAVEVLQQRVAEHVVVVGLAHDRGDRVATGLLGGAPATLAHDQLVRVLAGAAYDDRLQEADLLDGVHQLGERLLLEDLPRLAGVRTDLRDRAAPRSRRRRRCRAAACDPSATAAEGVAGSIGPPADDAPGQPRPAAGAAGWGRSGSASRGRGPVRDAVRSLVVHAGAPLLAISRAASR